MTRNIIFACLIALVLIFIIQNTDVVEFRFLMWTVSISRALMLFGTLAVGLVTGWFLGRSRRKKKSHT
jgi:uncharacterized integral membrane protein